MDDVDSTQAQIARNMLESGNWVTAKLNGVAYLEKSPLIYWMMALSYKIFGVHDWAARLPIAIATIMLCWVTCRFASWAISPRVGFYAGLTMATSIGLFLFTRILIPDSTLTLVITIALWAFLRAVEPGEIRPLRWTFIMAASIATGLLLKGLIAAVFPSAAIFLYLAITKQLFVRRTWAILNPLLCLVTIAVIALPWHILATLQNPPYFEFTLVSEAGHYHGFFWFYFFNEHLLRFLNLRYPRDYNTVPRLWFWASHLVWFFPWSAFLPGVFGIGFSSKPTNRAERLKLLAVCWIGFVMVFFTLSTTQEYYSMPIYPAIAILLGCAMVRGGKAITIGKWVVFGLATLAALAVGSILFMVRGIQTSGDIAGALAKNVDESIYTLSLGHMGDLTLTSFAYLRLPLCLAGVAFLIGSVGILLTSKISKTKFQPFLVLTAMTALFLIAARVALIVFEPYLGSRLLAEALQQAQTTKPGMVIVDNQYYAFSSVFFYANVKGALLLNGRVNNLEYGSYAPGAPDVFINDLQFQQKWRESNRTYLLVEDVKLPHIEQLVGKESLHVVKVSGGKFLIVNRQD